MKIKLFSDGACLGNPGPGGWGTVLLYGEHTRRLSGYEVFTTNNRMEIMAVIKGLECLRKPVNVHIITDSQYVKNAFTKGWLEVWQKNGWKTSSKEAVKNQDLWQELLVFQKQHYLTWEWVKGHSGNYYNDMCDELAREAISKKHGIDEKI